MQHYQTTAQNWLRRSLWWGSETAKWCHYALINEVGAKYIVYKGTMKTSPNKTTHVQIKEKIYCTWRILKWLKSFMFVLIGQCTSSKCGTCRAQQKPQARNTMCRIGQSSSIPPLLWHTPKHLIKHYIGWTCVLACTAPEHIPAQFQHISMMQVRGLQETWGSSTPFQGTACVHHASPYIDLSPW